MNTFTALAITVPRHTPDRPAEVVARAASLPALAKRVRRLMPAAALALFGHAPPLLCEGLPIRGMARAPGRTIYLCGPAE